MNTQAQLTLWDAARSWTETFAALQDKRDIWEANLRRAKVRPQEAARLAALPGPRRVLVLTEDWCGDAARSIPGLAAALDAVPGIELRCLDSDAHPEAIDGYLTHGGRAIPMVIVHDEQGRELGAWGPRPAPLQALLRERLATEGSPTDEETKATFYAPIMAWYSKDRGVTVLQEVLMLLERGGKSR